MSTVVANPYTAAASAVGYLYQCRYALLLLLQRSKSDPSVQIALEKFDDISFEQDGIPTELIQTKHHLKNPPDLTDTSTEIWKTLRVWSDALHVGKISIPATSLTIVTCAACATGSAAAYLKPGTAPSRDPDRAHDLLVAATNRMSGEHLKPARASFLRLPEKQRREMLKSVDVIDGSPTIMDVQARIREALGFPVRTEHLPAFQARLEGWWFANVIQRLSGATNDPITGLALQTEIDDLRDSFRADSLPVDFRDVTPANLANDDDRTFARQLKLINFGGKRIRWAQIDYFRAFAQRSLWVKDNLLAFGHLEDYDRLLAEEWEREFDRINDGRGNDDAAEVLVERGVKIYDHFQQNCRPIRPNCTEPYVGRGSYQLLADRLKVGWHPDFTSLLSAPTQPATEAMSSAGASAAGSGTARNEEGQ